MIVVSLGMQGMFSGFIPAAIALTSVSVPDSRISRSLGVVTGGQYLGSTLGPLVGSVLALTLGYQSAIVISAMLPAIAATWIIFAVPRDFIPKTAKALGTASIATKKRFSVSLDMFRGYSRLFWVMVVLYFGLFALNQMVRVTTPVVLENMVGEERASALSGIAFTIAGVASVIGVTILARLMATRMNLRQSLIVLTVASAATMPLMAAVHFGPWVYLLGFMLFALVNSASMPATNTLIASTVDSSRRGSAFGMASSAQALAFMVGPFSAAWFAKVSFPLGFIVAGVCFALLSAMLVVSLRDRRQGTAAELLAASD